MSNIIYIKNLCKEFKLYSSEGSIFKRIFIRNYSTIHAIKDFSLEVEYGEILGILGQNGAGKTTLIKMLTGILTPTSGSVQILNMNPQKQRYLYSYHLGVVFGQKSLLWHNIPVQESLQLYRDIYEINKNDYTERIKLYDEMFNIGELLPIPVRKLSLGQRMKCEIAASLLHNPEILFLDEPTIGLDVLAKNQIYDMLEKMNQQHNTTILLTTHNLDDVERLCNRIILLDDGSKVYDGLMSTLVDLDPRKILSITASGDVSMLLDIGFKLTRQDTYELECASNEVFEIIGKIGKVAGGNIKDIQISGQSLEDIIAKLYQGKLQI